MSFVKKSSPKIQAPISLPLEKKVWRKFKDIVMYPIRVSQQFSNHQRGVTIILAILNYDKHTQNFKKLASYIKKDANSKFTFITMWIFLAFFSSGVMAYKNKSTYIKYYELMSLPIKETRLTAQVGEVGKKIYYAIRFIPVSKEEFSIFLIFYAISIVGARFASYNPAFKMQEAIQKKLTADGKHDENGNPWMVVWTREAILIKTYGNNDDKLFGDKSFWTDINFVPTTPKSNIKQGLQFLVFAKKEEVARNLTYDFDGYFKSLSQKQNDEHPEDDDLAELNVEKKKEPPTKGSSKKAETKPNVIPKKGGKNG